MSLYAGNRVMIQIMGSRVVMNSFCMTVIRRFFLILVFSCALIPLFSASTTTEQALKVVEAPKETMGGVLYRKAFPQKLYNDNGLSTLGRALYCWGRVPVEGTLVDDGLIENTNLMSTVVVQLSSSACLNLGKAACAAEMVSLKPMAEIMAKQEALRLLTPEINAQLASSLNVIIPYENSFLEALTYEFSSNSFNVSLVDSVLSPLSFQLILLAVSGGSKIIDENYRRNVLGAVNTVIGFFEDSHSQELIQKKILADLKATSSAGEDLPCDEEVRKQAGRYVKAAIQGLSDTAKSFANKSSSPPSEQLRKLIALYSPNILFTYCRKTAPLKWLDARSDDLQNMLKRTPWLYSFFHHFMSDSADVSLAFAGYSFGDGLSRLVSLVLEHEFRCSSATVKRVAQGTRLACGAAWAALGAYRIFKTFKGHKELRDRLVPVAQVVRQAKLMYTILSQNQGFFNALPGHVTEAFKSFFAGGSKPLTELVKFAHLSTFNNTTSFFFVIGNAARLAHLALENREAVAALARAIGYLDYLVACSDLMNKSKVVINQQGQKIEFSYANFITQGTPCFSAKGLWYPGFDRSEIVSTDVSLGKQGGAQDLLITGVNECGKSIVMSAMSVALVMAHTHGFVPAQENSMTEFKEIIFHGNMIDNKELKLSKGAQEMVNCANIIKRVSKLEGHAFITFDELFSSTDYESGERLSSVVMQALMENPNVMIVAATHNRGLIRLANDAKGRIKNAFVAADLNEETGDVTYQRQLTEGINRAMPALFIMKNKLIGAGVTDPHVMRIIDNAIEEQRKNSGFVASE